MNDFYITIYGVDKIKGKIPFSPMPKDLNELLGRLANISGEDPNLFLKKVKSGYSLFKNGIKANDYQEKISPEDKIILIGHYLGG